MKILQIVQKPQRRGAEIFASQLSGRLRTMDHDVRTAYLYPNHGESGLPIAANDTLLGGREHHALERIPGVHPVLLSRLRRVIAKWKPDVVQVNGGRTLKYGAAAKAVSGGRDWVLVYRSIGQPGTWVRAGIQRKVYSSLVMPQVDGIVAVSAATRHALAELYNLTVPIACIPRAVDPMELIPRSTVSAIRREAQTTAAAPVVLYVGSLTAEKRLDRLLRVVATLSVRMRNLALWIVGDGPLRAALEAQARTLSLDHVWFGGVKDDVASYMNAANVVALTSDTEGMPGVVLEAGLLRRPVVATRVGGVSECVLNGRTGIVVDRDNEQALAQEMAGLLADPDRMRRLGDAAHSWIEEHFTLGRIAEQYEAFYADVIARTAAAGPRRESLPHAVKGAAPRDSVG
jgi:glycosyltransferase involved in cell wall biosynthesis